MLLPSGTQNPRAGHLEIVSEGCGSPALIYHPSLDGTPAGEALSSLLFPRHTRPSSMGEAAGRLSGHICCQPARTERYYRLAPSRCPRTRP